MTPEQFIARFYVEQPGSVVTFRKFVRHFYDCAGNIDIPFTWTPARIRRVVETRFPVGLWACQTTIGNIASSRSCVQICDRALVVEFGRLLPRDLRPHEYQQYQRAAEAENRQRGRVVEDKSA